MLELDPRKGRAECVTVAIGGTFAANNSEDLREAALAGLGIALLPDFSAAKDIAAGRLVRLLPKWRSVGAFGEQLFAVRPYTAQVRRAINALIGYFHAALASGFPVER